MRRIVVVSNRVARNTGKATAGGLAVALGACLQGTNGIWAGWSGEFSDAEDPQPQVSKSGGITYITFDLSRDDYEDYYNGFANRTLWPLCHYRIDLTAFDRRYYAGYQRVNAYFARALAPYLEPDDVVWVHDFHLMTLGEELRRLGCRNPMGYFLHIPFPAPQLLLTLPTHRNLVEALCAYDIIGFQTEDDLRAFTDYIVYEAYGRVIGDGVMQAFGRRFSAAAFPIGLDTENFRAMKDTPEARQHAARMSRSSRGRSMIVGVDRLDYTKGILERFVAFERFLARHGEWRGKVSLLQIAPPSRVDVPEYVEMRRQLEAASGRINSGLAEFDWTPIRYINTAYSRRALAGIESVSRVGLVTPFRDGMNLVAKEYVVAQDPADPGVLILSRFAGAARQLRSALIVNPFDIDEIVEALQVALAMDVEERRNRHAAMLSTVERDDVFRWRDEFINRLMDVQPTADWDR